MELDATTILALKHEGTTVMAGDGQVTLQEATIMKHGARKIRRLKDPDILAGFAGSTADAMALFERFEGKLDEAQGRLAKAVVELAKEWRTDRMLRRLEALLVVADADDLFLLTGTGDVIEPDDDCIAVGSGGSYALAAARALKAHSDLDGRGIAEEAMRIAADLCVYTNDAITLEAL